MMTDTSFLCGMGVAFVLCLILAALFRRAEGDMHDAEGWRKQCGHEQQRGDQWRALFERQRFIEDLSPAAARQEQFDIDRRARVLGCDVRATRRAEP
jgi:heme oxygenase